MVVCTLQSQMLMKVPGSWYVGFRHAGFQMAAQVEFAMRMVQDLQPCDAFRGAHAHCKRYVPRTTYERTNVPTPPALCLGTPVPRQKSFILYLWTDTALPAFLERWKVWWIHPEFQLWNFGFYHTGYYAC